MIRILFVDDEPRILRALQRMLFDRAEEWDMAFAESGTQALDFLGARNFDVIVTDMRMPDMDGAELLHQVMQHYPHVVRIVLSGHSDRERILRTVGETHQYLAKPCDPEKLYAVVTRACALRRYVTNDHLRDLISRISTIPSPPELYYQIQQVSLDPHGSVRKAAEIISRDIGMTAKILQIVNSAYIGLPRHVADPLQAVNLLGLETLKALILSSHAFSELATATMHDLHLDHLWRHSMATGLFARKLAIMEKRDAPTCDHAMIAGVLHDSGKLLLAANLPTEYQQALQMARTTPMSWLDAEKEVFGTTHGQVGAYLLGLWGLPDPIVEAVAYHHHPADCTVNELTPLTLVHVADALLHTRSVRDTPEVPHLDMPYLERLRLTDRIQAWTDASLEFTTIEAAT